MQQLETRTADAQINAFLRRINKNIEQSMYGEADVQINANALAKHHSDHLFRDNIQLINCNEHIFMEFQLINSAPSLNSDITSFFHIKVMTN